MIWLLKRTWKRKKNAKSGIILIAVYYSLSDFGDILDSYYWISKEVVSKSHTIWNIVWFVNLTNHVKVNIRESGDFNGSLDPTVFGSTKALLSSVGQRLPHQMFHFDERSVIRIVCRNDGFNIIHWVKKVGVSWTESVGIPWVGFQRHEGHESAIVVKRTGAKECSSPENSFGFLPVSIWCLDC